MIIMLIAAILRSYRMSDLAVFLADQASDSTAVYNILHGGFTLLGPITSIGGFYNGPIVYYLMAPVFWIFHSDPLSGTIFKTILSCFTIPFIFLIGKKVWNEATGFLAGFIFAISPLMIEYSRSAFNSYPAIFFSTVIVYLIFSLKKPFSNIKLLLIGICVGWIIQMHYLTIAFVLFIFLYPFFYKAYISWRYYLIISIGILIGFAPFLIFELRHDFLNMRLMINYFTSSYESERSLSHILTIWPRVTGEIIGGNKIVVGTGLFIMAVAVFLFQFFMGSVRKKNYGAFVLLFCIMTIISAFYGKKLESHYVIVFHTSLILLVAATVVTICKSHYKMIVVIAFIAMLFNATQWNIAKNMHLSQDGLSIQNFTYAASLIQHDQKLRYNVAMHAQGDNRAMPLRYTLLLLGEHPKHYDTFTDIDHLYFIIPKKEKIEQQTMWEYTAFGPSTMVNMWSINEEYYLIKLEKNNNHILTYNFSTH